MQTIALATAVVISWSASHHAEAFEVQTGFDVISSPDTTIEGLHRLFVGYDAGNGLSLGQSLYSASVGDAGGAFFWGYEAAKTWPLGSGLSFGVQAFVGGGGGASQVIGDGLMLRLGLGLELQLDDRWAFQIGGSRLSIHGGDEDATALSFGLVHREPATDRVAALRSVSVRAGTVRFGDALTRSGVNQPALALLGAEFAFAGGVTGEWLIAADGAASGGDGYMQVLAGSRYRRSIGGWTGFVDAAFGYGGGGDVDTGGGALFRAGLGAAIPLSSGVDLEIGFQQYWLLDVGTSSGAVNVGLTRVLDRPERARSKSAALDWAFTTGISQQVPNAGFRKTAGASSGRPLMQETSIDLFFTDRIYMTGNAQTVLGGDAAGYAMGLVGAGLSNDLLPRTTLSIEGLIGAAGGGGVNVGSGLVAGFRAEVDFQITPGYSASLSVGRYRALDGAGWEPSFVGLGLKVPFRTNEQSVRQR